MIKQDIVQRVADRLGITKVKAAEVVVGFFDVMKEALKDGERIELRGFGVLMVKNRKTGIGRNPKTGEVKQIPVGKTVRFKPGKNLESELID
ncbi:MAG TPA: HU family DNA-binding protein [Acidobacteriota bacterium]|nr:integration host factor subunit beta [Acidobacteriota bacterium]HNT99961.1 HU family DNA-binding protein [Acidobacteriota bacterium]HOB52975.1 HU family DNA-binding protein [Acidobacteriota bacterium]HOT02406.1 HU family DNA-binding protein [Acidobacteriota bacterium]HQF87192.1 HU family DNA-binding protein [Acidobacteriota bacterium]